MNLTQRKPDLKSFYSFCDKAENKRHLYDTETRDGRLRNTQLLLKRYSYIKIHVERAEYHKEKTCSDLLKDYLIWDPDGKIEAESTSIMKSVLHSNILIEHIDWALSELKEYCDTSCKQSVRNIYCAIYLKFLEGRRDVSNENVAERLGVDRSTVARYIKKGEEILSGLLFGVDSLI